jgi:hypothetical protein
MRASVEILLFQFIRVARIEQAKVDMAASPPTR